MLVGGGIGLLLLLNTEAVRAPVLDTIFEVLRSRYRIDLRAERVDLNLLTLNVTMYGVEVMAPETRDTPFLTAERVRAALPPSVVLGDVTLDSLEMARPRITIIRAEDGTLNLPRGEGLTETPSDPAPIRLNGLELRDLDFQFTDRPSAFELDVRGVTTTLEAQGEVIEGPIVFGGGVRLRHGDRETTLRSPGGRLEFDGLAVTVHPLPLESPEGRVVVEGRIDPLVVDKHLTLDYVADLRLGPLLPWFGVQEDVGGAVHVEGRVEGPPGRPEATTRISGESLSIAGLRDVAVRADSRVGFSAIEVEQLEARVAGGTLEGRGRLSLDPARDPSERGVADLSMRWDGVDAEALVSGWFDDAPVRLGTSISGSLDARWEALDARRVSLRADNRSMPSDGTADRLQIDGLLSLSADAGAWEATLDHDLSGGVRVTGSTGGRLESGDLGGSTLSGALTIEAEDLGRSLNLARGWGLTPPPGLDGSLAGRIDADVRLAGTLGSPHLAGTLEAREIAYASTSGGVVTATFGLDGDSVRLDSMAARLGANRVGASARMTRNDRRIVGRVDARLDDLAALAVDLPIRWRPAGALRLDGTLGGDWPRPTLASTVTGEDLQLAGQAIARLSGAVTLQNDSVTVERLQLLQPEGRLDLGGRYDFDGGTYTVRLTGRDLVARPIPAEEAGAAPAPLRARFDATFEGTGSTADPRGSGRLDIHAVSWADRELGALEVDVSLIDGTARFDTRLAALGAVAAATLDWRANRLTVTGVLEAASLEELAARALPDEDIGTAGSLRGSLAGSIDAGFDVVRELGRPESLGIDLDLRRLDGTLGETTVSLARPARLRYAEDAIDARGLELRVGDSTLTADGRLERNRRGALSAELAGDLADIVRVMGPFGWEAVDPAQSGGPLSVRLDATGTLDRPVLTADLRLSDGVVAVQGHPAITCGTLEATYRAGSLDIAHLDGCWQGATFSASGDLRGELLRPYVPRAILDAFPVSRVPSRVTGRLTALEAAALATYVDPEILANLEGRIDASVVLQVDDLSIDGLRGELRLDRADLQIAGISVDQVRPTRVEVLDGRLLVTDWEWRGPTTALIVEGQLQLVEPRTVDARVEGDLDLRLLNAFTDAAGGAGRARVTARIHGPAATPAIDGQIDLSDAELRTASARIAVTGLDGTIRLDGNGLTMDGLEGDANGGRLRIGGQLGYTGLQITDGSVTLEAEGMALEMPSGLRSEVDASLAFERESTAWTLSGAATIVRGAYREPLFLTAGLLDALDQRALQVELGAEPSRLDSLGLDLRILTDEDILVDNNYGRLSLAANVTLVGTLARPALAGRAEIREGGTIFLSGATYRIETGVIDFVSPVGIEPVLNLTARTQVSGYDITMRITGTPGSLEAELSTDEFGVDQSDLISILLTGRTTDEAGGAHTEVAREQVLSILSGELLGTAGRAVGLDVLRLERSGFDEERFDSSLVSPETDPLSRLTFGRNLTPDVHLVFSRDLRQSGDLTWILGYKPTSKIELRAVARDDNDRAYEFRHDLAFGRPRAAADRARDRPSVPRIATVRFTGEPGVAPSELRDLLRLAEGDRFDFHRWQTDRDRIERFYLERGYREVRIGTRRQPFAGTPPDAAAVALEYELHPGPTTRLTIEGFDLPPRLRHEMEDAWARSVFDQFLLEDLQEQAARHLMSLGYLRASVTAEVEERPARNEKESRLRLVPRDRIARRRLVFEGNDRIGTGSLQELVRVQNLVDAAWIDPERLREAIVSRYQAEGFLAARVEVAAPEFEEDLGSLPVRITEGAEFVVSEIALDGVRALPLSEARGALGGEPGERFTRRSVEAAAARLDTAYRRAGFNAVDVAFATDVDAADGSVEITYVVEEGKQQVLREIAVSGAETTNPGVVERALDLQVGEPVDLEAWSRARKRLYDTNVFRRADVEVEPLVDDAGQPPSNEADHVEPVRARVLLEEWPRNRLRYGFQLNDAESLALAESSNLTPGFVTDLEHRNFLGRAVRTGVSLRVERDRRVGRTFLSTPSFFGLPVASTLFFSRFRSEFGEGQTVFISDGATVTAEQRTRPAPNLRVSYGYSFERNRTFDQDLDPNDPFRFDLSVNIARLTTTTLFDSRDDLLDATRGWFHSSTFEYSSPALGSDLRFVKYFGQQYYFRPLSNRVVLASAVRFGVGEGLGQDLIPTERFLAGGGNSVRGYGEDSLGPGDLFAGGERLLVLNQEIRYPIYKMFRGVGFFDAGNVFESFKELRPRHLKSSVGLGLRVDTPFVLLRIDYGERLGRASGDPHGRWFFSIGQMF